MEFSTLGLSASMQNACDRLGYTNPTDIQKAAIPVLINGQDLMGIAQTGGGKTAAFLLPVIEKIMAAGEEPSPALPNAVILAPTRELAQQIHNAFKELVAGMSIRSLVIYGGTRYKEQLTALRRGVHVVVATPGRLLDHVKRGSIYFDQCDFFVLDEADRMLDMGFIDDVKDIHKKLKKGHQTTLFSATMSPQIRKLADQLLNEPAFVEVSPSNTVAETITHKMMGVRHDDKVDLLNHILRHEEMGLTLIFTKTKLGADRLMKILRGWRLKAESIHGDKPQDKRERILKQFKTHKIQYLVATDVAARGIDVQDITHVINYDMPLEGDSYVHRVGRTGRAGQTGTAISLCATDEYNLLFQVERTIGIPVMMDEDHPYHAVVDSQRKARNGRKGGGRGKPRARGRDGKPAGRGRDSKPHPATKRIAKRQEGGNSAEGGDDFRPAGRGSATGLVSDRKAPRKPRDFSDRGEKRSFDDRPPRKKRDFNDSGEDKRPAWKSGPKKDGAKRDGFKKDSPKREGFAKDGAKRDGFKKDGPKRDSFKKDGPKRDSFKKDGAKSEGSKSEGFKKSGFKKDGPKQDDFSKSGPKKSGPKKSGPKKSGPKKSDPKKAGKKSGVKKSAAKGGVKKGGEGRLKRS